MRLLLTFLLVISFLFSSAQINKDSLLIILLDETKDTSIRLEALYQYGNGLKSQQAELKSDNKFYYEKKIADSEKEIQDSQSWNKKMLFFFLGIFFLAIFVFIFYNQKRKKKNLLDQEKLLQQIDSLKEKLASQVIATPVGDKKILTLNKEKIEKAINSKIGESSWNILNLIFNNPSISNKEISEEVSLSIEGVSSSLRRMYQAFDIKTSSNKKITLIMKATRLSFEN